MKLNNAEINQEFDNEKGYVDEYGVFHGVDQDEKLFKENERLLQRLTNAAQSKSNFGDVSHSMSYGLHHDNTATTEHIVDITGAAGMSASHHQVQELIKD